LRALVQRVSQASVSIEGHLVAAINQGLVVLTGVGIDDSEADAQYLAEKIANLRIFSDESGKFNLSLLDINGEVIIVSQFTLFASTRKGRRPSFTDAAPPEKAEPLVDTLAQFLGNTGINVQTGRFQQYMMVEIHNDGPVTILLDSQDRLKPRRQL
jgi:D-tyrosyl-tRNA(Tyr) deacylase